MANDSKSCWVNLPRNMIRRFLLPGSGRRSRLCSIILKRRLIAVLPIANAFLFTLVRKMSESTKQHRCDSPKKVRCAVVTISDTRTLETDRGGELIVKL